METDLFFCGGNQSTNVLTSIERKTRFIILEKNGCKQTDIVARSFVRAIKKIPGAIVKSSTFDRGAEFVKHALLRELLGIQTFFCNPYSP